MSDRRIGLIAVAAAVAAFAVSNALELGVMRLTGADAVSLAYLSDAILAILMAIATYLWLHVRGLRGQLTELERKRVGADTELELAARIQRSALEGVSLPTSGLLWHAETRPAGRIGGDFYDLVALDEDTTLLLVADVSGKGVPAAIGLASARAAFRIMVQTLGDPKEIAERWSRWLYADTGGAPYLTALLVRLERGRRRIRYVNAGHPAGLLLWPGGESRLPTTCPPLGLLPAPVIASAELDLPRGAIGLLVTDGVSEALENDGDPVAHLATLVRPWLALRPQEVSTRLLAAVRDAHTSDVVSPDDQTVMAFKVED